MSKSKVPDWPTSPHQKYEGPPPIQVNDPRYPIFCQRYKVRIKWQQGRTVDNIREYGVPHTGIAQFDGQVANEERVVMLTINELVELFKVGCPIGVCHGPDTKKIYEAISLYLELWKNKITRSLNKSSAPTEDLLALDQFAHSVYERAKWHFPDEFVSLHMTAIRNSGVRSLVASIKVKEKPQEEVLPKGVFIAKPRPVKGAPLPQVDLDNLPEEEDPFKPRESYADFFKPASGTAVNIKQAQPLSEKPEQRTTTTNPAIERLLGNLGKKT